MSGRVLIYKVVTGESAKLLIAVKLKMPPLLSNPTRDKMNEIYKSTEFKSTQDLDKYNGNELKELYEIVSADLSTNRTKLNVKFTFLNLLSRFKKLTKDYNDLKKKQESIDNEYPTINQQSNLFNNNNNKYNNYADCLQNKKIEHIVIIKKKDKSNNFELKKKVFDKLNIIKKNIEVKPILTKDNIMKLNAKDEQQQNLIIDQFKDSNELIVNKPKKINTSCFI